MISKVTSLGTSLSWISFAFWFRLYSASALAVTPSVIVVLLVNSSSSSFDITEGCSAWKTLPSTTCAASEVRFSWNCISAAVVSLKIVGVLPPAPVVDVVPTPAWILASNISSRVAAPLEGSDPT